MILDIKVASLENVPTEYHPLYTEKDGAFILTGVKGMKTQEDIDKLKGSLDKERNDHKLARERLAVWGDLDHEQVRSALDRIPELESAAKGKLNDEDINRIVEQRLGAKTAPLVRDLETARTQLAERDKVIEQYTTKERTRTVVDAITQAAGQLKVLPTAMEDVRMYAGMFTVDEDGTVVTTENAGIAGLSPKAWLDDMVSKRPHWFPPSQGGGASGGAGGAGNGVNPWAKDSWNATAQAQIIKADPAKAERMAKAAGTVVGGLRPTK